MVLFKTTVKCSLLNTTFLFKRCKWISIEIPLYICRESGVFLFNKTEISYIFDALCQAGQDMLSGFGYKISVVAPLKIVWSEKNILNPKLVLQIELQKMNIHSR